MIRTAHTHQTSAGFFPVDGIEKNLVKEGMLRVVGVDEAGRGPLAGPVVAAAVVYRDCPVMSRVRDSKSINAAVRKALYDAITEELEFSADVCEPGEIDRVNILQASLLAMERAVRRLKAPSSIVLVDGTHRLNAEIPSRAVVRGDARVAVISAASIVAKVTRDLLMTEYDAHYPQYGFARNFGYPTPEHRQALRVYGPCPIHRLSFRGVATVSK